MKFCHVIPKVILWIFMIGGIAHAHDCLQTSPPTCAYVPVESTVKVTPTAFAGSCKNVMNNCAGEIMVPTATADEWDSFTANHLACVTLSDCGCTGPNAVNGHCYYMGAKPVATCNAICAGHGGCDAKGVDQLGLQSTCQTVGNMLASQLGTWASGVSVGGGVGDLCQVSFGAPNGVYDSPTPGMQCNSQVGGKIMGTICACNQ